NRGQDAGFLGEGPPLCRGGSGTGTVVAGSGRNGNPLSGPLGADPERRSDAAAEATGSGDASCLPSLVGNSRGGARDPRDIRLDCFCRGDGRCPRAFSGFSG